MRKSMKKRLLAFSLAMFMIFSTMGNASLTVSAAGTTVSAVTAEDKEGSDVVTETGEESVGTSGEAVVATQEASTEEKTTAEAETEIMTEEVSESITESETENVTRIDYEVKKGGRVRISIKFTMRME